MEGRKRSRSDAKDEIGRIVPPMLEQRRVISNDEDLQPTKKKNLKKKISKASSMLNKGRKRKVSTKGLRFDAPLMQNHTEEVQNKSALSPRNPLSLASRDKRFISSNNACSAPSQINESDAKKMLAARAPQSTTAVISVTKISDSESTETEESAEDYTDPPSDEDDDSSGELILDNIPVSTIISPRIEIKLDPMEEARRKAFEEAEKEMLQDIQEMEKEEMRKSNPNLLKPNSNQNNQIDPLRTSAPVSGDTIRRVLTEDQIEEMRRKAFEEAEREMLEDMKKMQKEDENKKNSPQKIEPLQLNLISSSNTSDNSNSSPENISTPPLTPTNKHMKLSPRTYSDRKRTRKLEKPLNLNSLLRTSQLVLPAPKRQASNIAVLKQEQLISPKDISNSNNNNNTPTTNSNNSSPVSKEEDWEEIRRKAFEEAEREMLEDMKKMQNIEENNDNDNEKEKSHENNINNQKENSINNTVNNNTALQKKELRSIDPSIHQMNEKFYENPDQIYFTLRKSRVDSLTMYGIHLTENPTKQFNVMEKLGQGAYGWVYKALDKKTGDLVAIKAIPLNTEHDQDNRKLASELHILSKLRNIPGIISYLGSYLTEHELWVVLEFCDAGSIGELVTDSNLALNESHLAACILPVVQALYHIHNENIIHRDIKGENILVLSEGTVKLADFGVACMSNGNSKRNSVQGSPYWMAPELIDGDLEPDCSADIWSLGITMIQLLDKVPPYYDYLPVRVSKNFNNFRVHILNSSLVILFIN